MERILLPDVCSAERFLDKVTARKRKRPAAAAAASSSSADAAEAVSTPKGAKSAATTPPKAPRRAYELNARRPNTESSSSLSSFSTASNGSAISNLSMCSFQTPRARAQRGDTIVIAVVTSQGAGDD